MAKGKRSKKAKNRKSKLQKIISEQHQANVSMNESDQDIQQAQSSQHSCLQNKNEEDNLESVEQPAAIQSEIQDVLHKTQNSQQSCLQNKNEEDNLESVEQPVAIQDALHKTQNSQHSSLQNKNEEDNLESVEQPIAIQGEMQDVLHKTEKDEHTDIFFNIENLPEEILMMIFEFLTLNELCRAARVCKTWYRITRHSVFWGKIRVTSPKFGTSKSVLTFLRILPSSVTSLNLNPDATEEWYLNFCKFSKELKKRCPYLKTLILNYPKIEVEKEDIVQNCVDLPENIQVLAIRHSDYFMKRFGVEPENPLSNIEVLDLSYSTRTFFSCYSFKRMPKLKKLHLSHCEVSDNLFGLMGPFIKQLHVFNLEGTFISSKTFDIIRNYGEHLIELYVCWTLIEDKDLIFSESRNRLPCLKKICLRGCFISSIAVNSLIESCPSLCKVFVGFIIPFPHSDYSSCNSEKVEVLDGFHNCYHSGK